MIRVKIGKVVSPTATLNDVDDAITTELFYKIPVCVLGTNALGQCITGTSLMILGYGILGIAELS